MTKRNKYSPEFKTEAINMVLNEGKSVDQVGKSLGVHPTSIRAWILKDSVPNCVETHSVCL